MTLRINTTQCDKPEELRQEYKEEGHEYTDLDFVTKAVGFAMNYVGIGRITRDNAGEVFRRFQAIEEIDGAQMFYRGEPQMFTMEDVERRIGLVTNTISKGKREFNRDIREEKRKRT